MSNNCSTCKYWGTENTTDDYEYCIDGSPAPEVRKCLHPNIRYKYQETKLIEDGDKNCLSYPSEGGAMVWDGSGYHAAFGTTGTFGCVLYEAEEVKP